MMELRLYELWHITHYMQLSQHELILHIYVQRNISEGLSTMFVTLEITKKEVCSGVWGPRKLMCSKCNATFDLYIPLK